VYTKRFYNYLYQVRSKIALEQGTKELKRDSQNMSPMTERGEP